MTSLGSQALAVPGDGMSREETTAEVDLPDIPESTALADDIEAQKVLSTAQAQEVKPYVPQAVDPWAADAGKADPSKVEAGKTVQVTNTATSALLPVGVGVPVGQDPATIAGDWQVAIKSTTTSEESGVPGMVMEIVPPATADPTAQVLLDVDTSGFKDRYGQLAAERFGLMLLPSCVLDSPDTGDCAPDEGVETMAGKAEQDHGVARLRSTVKDVPTAQAGLKPTAKKGSATRQILSGTVPVANLLPDAGAASQTSGASARKASLPAADGLQVVDASGRQVVGAMDTGSSASGDFTASPLLSAGSWAAGSSNGAFTYAYQVQTPETAGGLMPKVNLSYNSQSVDGRTSSTNNQASWIGDGWDYNPGSISRTYTNCRQDSKKAGANNKDHRTADLCWGSDNATLSLGGMTTELVWDAGKKQWFTANGDGSTVRQVTGEDTDNKARNNEYWIVTTKDGTKYHFGLNRLPGWSNHGADPDDPTTDSVLTAPVYGNHPDEPCYAGPTKEDWKKSSCTQGWQWNLDYVEDIHGNAMSFWWKKEQNYYAKNFYFKGPVKYDRGGYLSHIYYGQRKDTLFTATAPARIGFEVAERCYNEGTLTCSDDNFASPDPGKYRIWYDTPADLRCQAVTSTYKRKCWNAGPTFWTTKRLDKITTSAQRLTTTAARQVVDEYQLKQSFPVLRTGANTALWLESIQRTGYARKGSTDAKVQLNPVRFEYNADDMPNRVLRGGSEATDPRPGFSRLRVARVVNEYGGETVVEYKKRQDQCLSGTGLPGKTDTAALKSNTRLCYPSYWHPDSEVEDIDWFNKYVVDSIEELPNVAGSFSTTTAYDYKNAGWKLAEAEFTKKSTRTYSQFAGFEQTTVVTGQRKAASDSGEGSTPGEDTPGQGGPGAEAPKTKAVTRFYRGMGDNVPMTDVHGNPIKTADGRQVYDRDAFAGRIAEELAYTNATDADTDWLTRSITIPEATELASRDRGDGLTALKAWRVTEPEEVAYTKSSGTGDDKRTLRTVRTSTTYESTYGLPVLVESLGDDANPGDESCTKMEYLHDTTRNLIGLSKQVLASPTTCAKADWANLGSLSGAARTAYDNTTYGTALGATGRGLATESWSLNGKGTGFQSSGTTVFDAIGRVTKLIDPDRKESLITYDPPSGQVFKITETNPLGHAQVKEIEPGRAVTLKATDANGYVSESIYDPLGRLAEAWSPGRTPGSGVPDFRADYVIPQEVTDPDDPDGKKIRKPPYVTTYARGYEDRIEKSVTIYDGLGRERQSQEKADGGGRLITDTLYNSAGEVYQTNNAYLNQDEPDGELFTPLADTTVPNITRYSYDGLGRVLEEMPVLKVKAPGTTEAISQDVPEKAVRYEYGPDWSKVIQPQGTSTYQVFTDAVGRTVRTDTINPAAPGGRTSTRYEYDPRGQLAKATSSTDEAHPWSWTYDKRGRMETATDPDTGTTVTTYDDRDRPVTVANARGTVWNSYDELSRPKQQRETDANGKVLSDFTYDTVPGGKGLPATATRYTDGLAYVQKVNGYSKEYQPTSTTLSLPDSIVSTWGLQKDYTYGYTYSDNGMLDEATLPKAGKFDAEKLVVRYNKDGKPVALSGKDWYGTETVYSPYGQVMRSTLGAQPYRVWAQNSYDESTGELTKQETYREKADPSVVSGNLVSSRSYSYDPSGNVTGIREGATGIEENQCFTYDPLGQLKEAWTSKDQTACTTPKKADGSLNVAAGADGSGYWQQYEYDLMGNRKKLVEKDLSGNTAKDATTAYAYGKADGAQPHTLTKVSKTYTTPAGAQVQAEAERLYELTGETKQVTSLQNGDKQTLSWTYDGQIDRITGAGAGGQTPYVGLADKCLDLKSGLGAAAQPVQLYTCNTTVAQNWKFVPTPALVGGTQPDANRGTMTVYGDWCLQPAANTAGSAVQIQKCNGSAAQELKRNTAGQLIHPASNNLCLAVQGANATNGTAIVLAACDTASAAQLWGAQNDTRHIYGPGGDRLLTIKGKTATLYLGDTEVTIQPGGVLLNSQRTYSTPGGQVMRYAAGTAGDQLVAMTSDHQGSTYAEVAMSGTMAVRIRKQDPFGNQRGAGTVGANQQSHTGFLGKVRDDASGYTPLGARLYDPVVGRFLSADPMMDLNDPQQSNGYVYAHNNPVTFDDPSGLAISLTASERAAALAGAGLSAAQVAQAQAMQGKSLTSVILAVAWETLKDFIGINDAMACFGGDMWSCASIIIDAIPWTKLGKIPSVIKAVNRTIDAIHAFKAAKKAAEAVLKAAKAAEAAALRAKKAAIDKAKKEAAQRAKKKAAEAAKRKADAAAAAKRKTGNPAHKQSQAKAAPKSSSQPRPKSGGGGKSSGGKVNTSKPGGSSGGSSRNSGGSSGGGGSGKAGCNSFVPGTRVLMADGSTKPIEKVRTGDKVLATEPETGETRVETVTAEIKGQGLKHLVTVTIDTDGAAGDRTALFTATDGHPVWVPELRRWIKATDLKPGQWLRTSSGTYVQVTSVQRSIAPAATVHNLTVSEIHTYYVLAGATSLLVHNDSCPTAGESGGGDHENWAPDNYSDAEIEARQTDMNDLGAFFDVPEETHQLVADFRANPNMPARHGTAPDGLDHFTGRDLNPRQRAQWSSWIGQGPTGGALIYWNRQQGSQIRIMVHPTTGQIAWFPLTRGGVHNYGSPRIYSGLWGR
ncbi:ricin-type beta-trefoil lectin domain protein [Streptomyces sp. NPDC046371]|uniref:ricin-type beta-trefoil lectin domain protein n=1 Tax=unclassified Streptomyces TaxID=2593676 RepID=UPI003409BE22